MSKKLTANTVSILNREKIWTLSIPIFVMLLIVKAYLETTDIKLLSVENGMIGGATLSGIDVAARKTIFFFLSTIVALCFAAYYLLLRFVQIELKRDMSFLFDLSVLSLVGAGVLLFHFFNAPVSNMLNFLFALFGIRAFLFALRSWIPTAHSIHDKRTFLHLIFGGLAIAFSARFFIGAGYLNDYFLYGSGGMVLLFLLFGKIKTNYTGIFLKFVMLLPLVLLTGVEVCRIFFARGVEIHYIIPSVLFSGLLLFYLIKKAPSDDKLEISPIYYAGLLTAIFGMIFFLPAPAYPEDMFELANPANSMMRVFDFGEIPFVDFLSSHLLFDQLPGYLYVLLNGYDGSVDFISYFSVRRLIYALICFYFLRTVFKSDAIAFVTILFFPFMDFLIPKSYALALLSPILIYHLWTDYNVKKLVFVLLFSVGLLFYKIDLGLANLWGIMVLMALLLIRERTKKDVIDFLKIAFTGLGILMVIFFFTEWLTDGSLILNLKKTVAYFGADQAHGHSQVSYDKGIKFRYHHFLFPFLSLVTLFILLFFTSWKKKKSTRLFLQITLVFCIVFYLANFQRGLVRHSFIANTDQYLSSFIYLIIALTAMLMADKKWRLLTFFIVSAFGIHIWKFKTSNGALSMFERAYEVFQQQNIIPSGADFSPRVKGAEAFEKKTFGEVKAFMDEHFSPEATFLDFSNNPMLYYYTKRKVPSFFNQYLQNTVTDDLQKWNLEKLNELDIPIVIFSSIPEAWLDKTDGIPNALRYYRVSHHIYSRYRPFTVLNNKSIWLRNDIKGLEGNHPEANLSFIHKKTTLDLKHLPSLYTLPDVMLDSTALQTQRVDEKTVTCDVTPTPDKHFEVLHMEFQEVTSKTKINISLVKEGIEQAVLSFFLVPGKTTYNVPLSWLYTWYSLGADAIKCTSEITFSDQLKRASIYRIDF